MNVFVNWWRNKWLRHIQRTITHERIKIKAEDIGLVPQLSISWVINNRSMSNINISGISGSVFVGTWQVAGFETLAPAIKQVGSYQSRAITITQRGLKKVVGSSEVNIILFPPIEFWLNENDSCMLYDTKVESDTTWGKVITSIPYDRITIENIENVRAIYISKLKNQINRMLLKTQKEH